jgi:hypothetical protein
MDELGDHRCGDDSLEIADSAPPEEFAAFGRSALVGIDEDVRVYRDP